MKGDFSRWDKISNQNLDGVLHQQGRVLHDRDWNDQTRLTLDWQEQAGRDIIGARVMAVPADDPDGFKVVNATVIGDQVVLQVQSGRGWADGLHVTLSDDPIAPGEPVERWADYLGQPFLDPPLDPSSIAVGVRDAIVLEVWRDTLNGFQVPDQLIEPALGGPDTTERAYSAMRFRLLRLDANDSCESVAGKVEDDPSKKGKLRASLLPPTIIPGDCLVVEGGGYVGFEHFLYRVEIARTDAAGVFFKWSQFNGGLVGRGDFDPGVGVSNKKITLTANDQAIKTAGLSGFYLEVIQYDAHRGCWRVTYGADVTLNGDELQVATERYTELVIPSGRVFFRLWNELRPITDFPRVIAPTEPNELRDGIRLEFDADSGSNYQEGDYWTFPVRAGEIGNPDPMIDDLPPQGVVYHRVPLAILDWNADADPKISFDEGQIEDCRNGFDPLTKQSGCCSYQVGDGTTSFGDYNSIEEALRHLPAAGGEICLLPGFHLANVVIKGRRNIKISGCDLNTRVSPRPDHRIAPIFLVRDSQTVTLTNMDLVTFEGSAVVLKGTKPGLLREITIANNRILAFRNAIHALHGQEIHILHNQVRMLDRPGGDVAIFMQAQDGLVERNDIFVVPAGRPPGGPTDPTGPNEPTDPADPCTDPETIYLSRGRYTAYLNHAWLNGILANPPANPFAAFGGIQVGSGSERIKILENRIQGGAGNGITLGSDLDLGNLGPGEGAPPGHVTPAPKLINRQAEIWGSVSLNGQPLVGIALVFEPQDGTESSKTITGAHGVFLLRANSDDYRVWTTSGYRVARIKTTVYPDRGEFHKIELEEAPHDVIITDVLAFLYEIAIERNEISLMGLSGIGTPAVDVGRLIALARSETNRQALGLAPMLLRLVGGISGFVSGLGIRNNHVFRCLLNPREEPSLPGVAARGQGGISLLLVQNSMIDENRIEANGRDYPAPICGVYLAWAEQVGLSHNQILNNGPVGPPRVQRAPLPGVRGGIVVRLASTPALLDPLGGFGRAAGSGRAAKVVRGTSPERYALRVHDNLVQHPVGRALTVQTLGPLSIQNNQFFTDYADSADLDQLAGAVGAVLITDLGWPRFLQIGGVLARSSLPATTARASILPGGDVLFANNQTQLGQGRASLISQLILTAGDLGFHGNQSDVLVAPSLRINTVLLALTVRANDNRLQEPIQPQRR